MLFSSTRRLKLFSSICITMLALMMASEILFGLIAVQLLDKSKKAWHHYEETSYERHHVLDEVSDAMGHGGLIHNFKDYILSNRPIHRKNFEEKSAEITKSLNEFKQWQAITDNEKLDVDIILNIVLGYTTMLDQVKQGHEQGLPVSEINALVYLDDSAAMFALADMQRIAEAERYRAFEAVADFNRRAVEIERFEFFVLPFFLIIGAALMFLVNALVQEIASREAAEKKLLEKAKAESLGELAGGLAHEINNVLQPILSMSDSMRDRFRETDEKVARCMDTIYNNTLHARNIVRDILAFAHKNQKEADCLDIATVFKESIEFADEFLPSDVTLDTTGLYFGEREEYAILNRTGMVQVLVNLFVNAGHAMDGKGVITLIYAATDLNKNQAEELQLEGGAMVL